MCPPCLRAHTRVRPYKTIGRHIWDTTLVSRSINYMKKFKFTLYVKIFKVPP
jgi:hypothetical protein